MIESERAVDMQSGKKLAYEWTKRARLHPNSWQNQRRRYADLLAERCVAESVRLRESEDDLWSKLLKAGEVLDGVWYACAPHLAREHWDKDKWPEDKRLELMRLNEVVWVRHDLNRVYELGYVESLYPGVDRRSLASYAAEYLSLSWLRVAALDWLFVDAFVTDEIAQYGEHLKRSHLPGPTDVFERIKFDDRTKGNHAAIVREGRRYRPRPLLKFFGIQVLLPMVGIATAVYFEAWKTALAVIALSALDLAWIGFRQVVLFFRRMRSAPEQLRTPSQVDHARLIQMREVWRLLEGPVINPTLLRAEMVRSTDKGAVWESAAWAIVDRQINIDPTVWITSFPSY